MMEVFFYYYSDKTHIFEGSRHDPIERQPEDIVGKKIVGFKYDNEGNLILQLCRPNGIVDGVVGGAIRGMADDKS